MLSKTAGGLFWMFRYLERSENTSRLIEAGFHIALTRATSSEDEWVSVLTTAGVKEEYEKKYNDYEASNVIDFILRDQSNSSSVISVFRAARNNARVVRTALTREVWEAINEGWLTMKALLSSPIEARELPAVLNTIRQKSALVRGAMHGSMLRNEIYDFSLLGTFLERADNTARILDVKYYVLLPSVSYVGSSLDNIQWETVLRSVSAQRSYRWLNQGEVKPMGIADFLILDRRMPRSLAFCYAKILDNLNHLAIDYDMRHSSYDLAEVTHNQLKSQSIEMIFENGLHEFILYFIQSNIKLGHQIEADYNLNG